MAGIIAVVLLWFFTPVAISCFFWKIRKPVYSLFVCLPVLIYSIIKNIFWYGEFKGLFREISLFLNSDGVLVLYLCWIPAIIGYVLINLAYYISRSKH